MSSQITSVKIRMYDTGSVGDCLLLLFMTDAAISFSLLIDCGGWNTTSSSVTPCVQDIHDTCNGKLDLLIVTHQHEDHVSGFNQARTVFDTITVNEVWMSWIENPEDSIAKLLKDAYGKKLQSLKQSISANLVRMRRFTGGDDRQQKIMKAKQARMMQALELLKFEEGSSYGAKLAVGKRTNDDAMAYVKGKGNTIKYLLPGRVMKLMPGEPGIKCYVLGPPRDKDMRYFKIDEEEDEMYHLAMRADARAAAFGEEEETPLRTGGIFINDIALEDGVSPFRDEYQMERSEQAAFMKMYNGTAMRWRQIETDWMESDAAIAMRITRLTNNTSLAIAIELPDGNVLLLPADAQSGNWMGWHKTDVMKKLKDRGGKDTNELLRDTVFYKVGHHGSHNGTASRSGLDKMTSENLVAMMPLVQAKVPSAWGGAANFPAGPLYEMLIDRTHGRVIRTDEGIIKKASAVARRNELSAAKRNEFEAACKKRDHYVEYTVQCKVGG
jgi:beta-lactamase superfamily II metal-dependent hydrolase